jgi:protein-S-isoprenylcysteine O-methyltransferase
MLRKLVTAVIVSSFLWLLPAVGRPEAFSHPQLWALVVFGVLAGLFQPAYKPVDNAPTHDRGTATQLIWSVYLTQFASVIEAVYFRYPESFEWDGVATAALTLAVAGLGLRSWAFKVLGDFFTWHIGVTPGHKVVTSGPYRLLRHPSYTGAYLMYLFTVVFLHAWVVAALTAVALLFAFWRRIHHEEGWLRQHLGPEYVAYAQGTKALIPFVW